jgi:hypothetical protein
VTARLWILFINSNLFPSVWPHAGGEKKRKDGGVEILVQIGLVVNGDRGVDKGVLKQAGTEGYAYITRQRLNNRHSYTVYMNKKTFWLLSLWGTGRCAVDLIPERY